MKVLTRGGHGNGYVISITTVKYFNANYFTKSQLTFKQFSTRIFARKPHVGAKTIGQHILYEINNCSSLYITWSNFFSLVNTSLTLPQLAPHSTIAS